MIEWQGERVLHIGIDTDPHGGCTGLLRKFSSLEFSVQYSVTIMLDLYYYPWFPLEASWDLPDKGSLLWIICRDKRMQKTPQNSTIGQLAPPWSGIVAATKQVGHHEYWNLFYYYFWKTVSFYLWLNVPCTSFHNLESIFMFEFTPSRILILSMIPVNYSLVYLNMVLPLEFPVYYLRTYLLGNAWYNQILANLGSF